LNEPLPPELLTDLRALSSPTVCNAIETFNIIPRNAGFMNSSIRCVYPEMEPMVGYAVTAKIAAAAPAGAERRLPGGALWDLIAASPKPVVLVIEDEDPHPIGSFWGEVNANVYRALGCTGTVTNGGVRDLDEVRRLGFHFFAAHILVSHAYVHTTAVGGPVTVGGLVVNPGDLLHGDKHGVTTIPRAIAPELVAAAQRIEEWERKRINFCQSPEFSLEGLKELFGLNQPR
jgi:4-hydroxy-4-methyl-2-oxoglutarate aldolase